MPTPQQAERKAVNIVAAARALVTDPNNEKVRREYMHATFNLDWTAAAIVALAEGRAKL
jgi:hypothetical protein